MKQGIIILALKKDAYYCSAFNLALSIKYYNKDINITLLTDGGHKKTFNVFNYSMFDWIKEIDKEDMQDADGNFCPAKAKININKYSSYDNTLYIDADSIVLQDLQPLLDTLTNMEGNFYSNYFGTGGKNDDILYNAWATNEKLWSFFNLKDDAQINTINTSWIYFNKNTKKLFKKINENYNKNFGLENLKNKWGGTMPDELLYVGTLAQMGINPKNDLQVMFFGDLLDSRGLEYLQKNFFAFTLYGGGLGRTTVRDAYITWYDRLMFKMMESFGQEHRYKSHLILINKHINK